MVDKKSDDYVEYHGPETGGRDSNELVDLQTLSTQRQDRLVNALKERYHYNTSIKRGQDFLRKHVSSKGVRGDDIDLVLLCTSTPDETMPASASAIQQALGVRGGAVDLNAACSGFVYGLVAADGFLRSGLERVLLIGSETMSRIVDWEARLR